MRTLRSRTLLGVLLITGSILAGCTSPELSDEPSSHLQFTYVLADDPAAHPSARNFSTIDIPANESYPPLPWAVYDSTYGGNCCEHYIATTKEGWIVNIGGEYPWWSADRGRTWEMWQPGVTQDLTCRTPTANLPGQEGLGEGSVVQATSGDLLAMSWYPYPSIDGKADRFFAMLYDAEVGSWRWCYNRMTEPFYDRSWQVEVVGPISSAYGSGEWASLVISNFWHQTQGEGGQISVDGLNYYPLDFPDRSASPADCEVWDLAFGDLVREWDFTTPHREMRAMPLPTGGLLFPAYYANGANLWLDTSLNWNTHCIAEDVTLPSPHLTLDSSGTLHNVQVQGTTFNHSISLDGGLTWQSHRIVIENASSIEEWEFQSDGHHDLAVLAVRYQSTDEITIEAGTFMPDVDVVYHMRDYHASLEVDTMTFIGQGDLDSTSGAGNDVRFDFASLAIMEDGGVVVAYADGSDEDPLFAIELALPESGA